MHSALPLLLLTLALTACASSSARQPAAPASAFAAPTSSAASRLGPPSPRGLGFRRVDRPTAPEPPLALY